MKKTILVTGGAGFVGSHLCERLLKEGHTVISLDNYFAGSPTNHIHGVEYREGHTKDIDTLIPEYPDMVFHLGEYARVEKSFEDVAQVWDLNKTGTFAVLEFCRKKKCKLVYAGSSTKFSDEGHGRDGSPYAWTKATNTELVKNYGDWFGLTYAITYFYNVFGGRERGTGPFATLIGIYKEEYQHGNPLTVVAPGTQERNFTHVDDIVDGLILVGEKGNGDGYGIGNTTSYSILSVAKLFGADVVMLPPRVGNRLSSGVDTEKTTALGWHAKRGLEEDIEEFLKHAIKKEQKDHRVLIFSTTFHPVAGPAEEALRKLIMVTPNITFDIITTKFRKGLPDREQILPNAIVHRVGIGSRFDKYLLPLLGVRVARALQEGHSYLFIWSLLASYAALAGVLAKRSRQLPLLLTLADQQTSAIPWYLKLPLRIILGKADQVYASTPEQEKTLFPLTKRTRSTSSLGAGDAFANQIRFAYTEILRRSHER